MRPRAGLLSRLGAAGALAALVTASLAPAVVPGAMPADVAQPPGASTEPAATLDVAEGARLRQRRALTAYWSTGSAELDQPDVRVRGRLRQGGVRRVVLQVRRGDRWVRQVRGRTRDGRYRLGVPTSKAGTFVYRVVAPVSARQREAGLTRAVSVRTRFRVYLPSAPTAARDYEPPASALGDPSDFSYITSWNARWNPCSTITYRVNATDGPPSALQDTKGAVARIEEATGLDLEYLGPTNLVPQDSSADRHPADTQIVIAWASRQQSAMISGDQVAGVGGPMGWGGTVEEDGSAVVTWRRGTVVLNTEFNWLPAGFGDGTTIGKLLMHELGHVVGLGHAGGESQVMYPTLMRGYPTAWGAGDLSGLHSLGAAEGCIYEADGTAPSYRLGGVAVVSEVAADPLTAVAAGRPDAG